jgi:hypothetical protein
VASARRPAIHIMKLSLMATFLTLAGFGALSGAGTAEFWILAFLVGWAVSLTVAVIASLIGRQLANALLR